MVGDYWARQNPIQDCYDAAKKLNFKVFAVQDRGYCSSSETAHMTFDDYGPVDASFCVDGKGGDLANDVYRLNGKIQISQCLYNPKWY